MSRTFDVQFLGSAIVIGSFAAAEGAVRLLEARPGSALAWYLNVQVFRAFETARAAGSPLQLLLRPSTLAVTGVAFACLVMFRVLRFRFGLALAANLSFLAVICLAAGGVPGAHGAQAASLGAIAAPHYADGALVATLLLASFGAFLASHLAFLHAVTREASGRGGRRRTVTAE